MIDINLEDYNYELPEDRIAQYPVEDRDSARLLIYRNGTVSESNFTSIHEFIPEKSLLVFNNTKVIKARLLFKRVTGALIEVFMLEPVIPTDYSLSFSSREEVVWSCLVGNLKKWKEPLIRIQFMYRNEKRELTAEKRSGSGDTWNILFRWDSPDLTFGEIIELAGHVPLPPYIKRGDEQNDADRYQTIYSAVKGSVAAPTAGLHFTGRVFDNLTKSGISTAEVTLHVGAGTFQPVRSENIQSHEMHTEHFIIEAGTIEKIYNNPGRVVAVGTTSVRTLESLYWLGIKLISKPGLNVSELFLDQWEAYSMSEEIPTAHVLENILKMMHKSGLSYLSVPTRIMIIPGYRFRIINGLVTNFHLPKSTLLLLVSAFTEGKWKNIYDYALKNNFRFLSYGDGSLLLK